MNGVSDGPRRYESQYQIVAPTPISADGHEQAERAERDARAREAPLEQLLARRGVGRARHSRKVDNR